MASIDQTAQILQAAAQAQQERIRRMGDIRAAGAAAPGQAMLKALASYNSGRKMAAEEQQAQQNLELGEQKKNLNDLQLGKIQSEEDAANATDPNDPEGRSYREEAPGLAADTQRQGVAASEAQVTNSTEMVADAHARTVASANQFAATNKLAIDQFLDSHQRELSTEYDQQRRGLATLPEGAARDAQVQSLNNLYISKGLPASAVNGLDKGSQSAGDMAKISAAIGKENLFNLSVDGGRLNGAVSDAQNVSNYLQKLTTARQKYIDASRVPGFDTLGSLNETSPAADARREFAQLLNQGPSGDGTDGKPLEAQALMDMQTPWNTGLDQMNKSLSLGLQGAVTDWNAQGKNSVAAKYTQKALPNGQPQTLPNGQPNPAFQMVPNPDYKSSVGAIDAQFGAIQQQLNGPIQPSPPTGSIDPATGRPTPAQNIKASIAARKAAASGGTNAGPSAPPGQPPQPSFVLPPPMGSSP